MGVLLRTRSRAWTTSSVLPLASSPPATTHRSPCATPSPHPPQYDSRCHTSPQTYTAPASPQRRQATAGIVAAFATPRQPDEAHAPTARPGDPDPTTLDADVLADRAVWHGDEHVVKLTEAALREHARSHDTTLLIAAHRFADRVERP